MSDMLYETYLRMLKNLREDGQVFSKKYPDIARTLDINAQKSTDPETERLIESFAYMASQVDMKIEDNYFKFLENFSVNLFPEVVTPIPAYTILRVHQSESQKAENTIHGYTLSQGTYFKVKLKNNEYPFQTCRSLLLQDLSVQEASIKEIKLSEKEGSFEKSSGIHIKVKFGSTYFSEKKNEVKQQ